MSVGTTKEHNSRRVVSRCDSVTAADNNVIENNLRQPRATAKAIATTAATQPQDATIHVVCGSPHIIHTYLHVRPTYQATHVRQNTHTVCHPYTENNTCSHGMSTCIQNLTLSPTEPGSPSYNQRPDTGGPLCNTQGQTTLLKVLGYKAYYMKANKKNSVHLDCPTLQATKVHDMG